MKLMLAFLRHAFRLRFWKALLVISVTLLFFPPLFWALGTLIGGHDLMEEWGRIDFGYEK